MLLEDEQHVVKWLSQYGAITKTQLLKMLQKPPSTGEKILRNLRRELMITDINGGYYIGLDKLCKPDARMITAIWVLLKFISKVDPMAHYPAVYPSQLFFLKNNTGYEIVVLYDGETNVPRLLKPDDDLKYIIVLPHVSMYKEITLPKAECLFATVEYDGGIEPNITFYNQEVLDGKK